MTWTTPRTWVDGETVTASIFNTHVRDNIKYLYDGGDSWHNVGAAGEPAFQNSWVNYDVPSWGSARFRHAGPFTVIQGLVKNGAGSVIFTLPAGYRPSKYLIFSTRDSGAATTYAELRVGTDGTVVHQAGATTWFSVCCVFVAEQ